MSFLVASMACSLTVALIRWVSTALAGVAVCSDPTFVRRVSLPLTGITPCLSVFSVGYGRFRFLGDM